MRPLLSTERAQQAVVAGAVDLDPVAVGRLGIEGRPHDAGDLVLAADDPDVADRRARQAHHGRQLVEERREKRRPGVGHTRDDAAGRQVHELEDVVGILEPPPLALDGRRLEDLRPAADHSVVVRHRALPHAPDITGPPRGRAGVRDPLSVSPRDDHVTHLREVHERQRLEPGSDEESAAARAYEAFRPLNREVLQLCTDWQVRPGGALNDHTDATYDWSVIDRLTALDERAAPLLRRLGASVPHFAPYRERLRQARR